MVKKRAAFHAVKHLLPGKKLVFLDEAHIKLAQDRKQGWAKKGHKPVLRGTNYAKGKTMIGAIATDGTRAFRVQSKGANNENFPDYVRTELVPGLNEGDIVCMDQLKAHKHPDAIAAIHAAGARVLFLPTYSPELNPIEHIWSWLKREVAKIFPLDLDALDAAVHAVWERITDELCRACIEHCGYVIEAHEHARA